MALYILLFQLKFLILILVQMKTITNHLFLLVQCHSLDYLLRFGLNMDQGVRDAINGYQGAPGFQGPLAGFFGKNALGLGIGLPGPTDTPLGFETSDLGTGIYGGLGDLFGTTETTAPGFETSDLGTGLTGSLSSNFGNWGSDFGNFGGDVDSGSSRGETGDVAGSGTGNSGSEAEGMGGPDGPAGEGGGEGGDGE